MACTNFAAEKVSVDASSKNMNEKMNRKYLQLVGQRKAASSSMFVQANWLRNMAYKFKRLAGKLKLHHEYEYG